MPCLIWARGGEDREGAWGDWGGGEGARGAGGGGGIERFSGLTVYKGARLSTDLDVGFSCERGTRFGAFGMSPQIFGCRV